MCATCAEGADKYFGHLSDEEKMNILWSRTAFPFADGQHTSEQLRHYRGAVLQGKDVCEGCAGRKAPKHLNFGMCRNCRRRALVGFEKGFKPTNRQARRYLHRLNAGVQQP